MALVGLLFVGLVILGLQVAAGRGSVPREERRPVREWTWSDVWANVAIGRREVRLLLERTRGGSGRKRFRAP